MHSIYSGPAVRALIDQARSNGHQPSGRLTRDSQRGKVYRAEHRAQCLFPSADYKLSEREVAAFVRKVETSQYVVRKYGALQRNVDTRPRTRARALAYGVDLIELPRWAWNKWIILHEIAHGYTVADPGHGWLFCAVELDLVQHFLGAEEANALKAQYKAHKVKFTVPRTKRQLSPEQRAAASERLAKAREAKQGATLGKHVFFVQNTDWYGNPIGWAIVNDLGTYARCFSSSGYVTPRHRELWVTRSTEKGIANALKQLSNWTGLSLLPVAVPLEKVEEALNEDLRSIPADWSPNDLLG